MSTFLNPRFKAISLKRTAVRKDTYSSYQVFMLDMSGQIKIPHFTKRLRLTSASSI